MKQQQSYKQKPAQSAAEERRYVVAQATGVLTASVRYRLRCRHDKLALMAAEERRPVIDLAREMVKGLEEQDSLGLPERLASRAPGVSSSRTWRRPARASSLGLSSRSSLAHPPLKMGPQYGYSNRSETLRKIDESCPIGLPGGCRRSTTSPKSSCSRCWLRRAGGRGYVRARCCSGRDRRRPRPRMPALRLVVLGKPGQGGLAQSGTEPVGLSWLGEGGPACRRRTAGDPLGRRSRPPRAECSGRRLDQSGLRLRPLDPRSFPLRQRRPTVERLRISERPVEVLRCRGPLCDVPWSPCSRRLPLRRQVSPFPQHPRSLTP